MLLMSSIIVTVLPTPAPPKRPILPPLANGQMRSITLMPTSSSSVDGDSSSYVGASRWIDIDFAAVHRPTLVDRPSEHVHDAAERLHAHRHHDRRVGVDHLHAAAQAVGAAERDGAHDAVAQLLLHFEREPDLVELQRVVDFGDLVARKLHVDDRADALNNGSFAHDFL